MLRRSEGMGFRAWLENYIEQNRTSMTNSARKIHTKAAEHVGGLVLDSHALEGMLEAERAAHRMERLANIELSRKAADLAAKVEVLERQNEELRRFLDSGEISLP